MGDDQNTDNQPDSTIPVETSVKEGNLANSPVPPVDSSPSSLANDQTTISPPPESVWPDSIPPVIENQSSPDWPVSTNLANDQTEKPKESPVIEPPKEEVQPQVSPSEIGQVEVPEPTIPEATPSASTKLDSTNPVNPVSQPELLPDSVDSSPPVVETSPSDLPVLDQTETPPKEDSSLPPNLTNSPNQTNDSSTNQPSPQSSTSPSSPSNSPDLNVPDNPDSIQANPVIEEAKEDNIDISIVPNQAPQVQSEAPDSTPGIAPVPSDDELASFKPETPQSPQTPPSPPVESQSSSPTVTFGDILSGNTPTSNSSSAETQQPATSPAESSPVSFGDLIKDIEITPSVQPEAQRPVEQSPSPQPSPPPPQSISPSSPQISPQTLNPSQPQVVEKIVEKIVEKPVEVIKEVVKEITVTNQEEVDKQVIDKLKITLDERRILANKARSKKKQRHLDSILELARNTSSFSNTDIQRLLHVSQSTATNYLSELVSRGMLKREGIRGGAKYSL